MYEKCNQNVSPVQIQESSLSVYLLICGLRAGIIFRRGPFITHLQTCNICNCQVFGRLGKLNPAKKKQFQWIIFILHPVETGCSLWQTHFGLFLNQSGLYLFKTESKTSYNNKKRRNIPVLFPWPPIVTCEHWKKTLVGLDRGVIIITYQHPPTGGGTKTLNGCRMAPQLLSIWHRRV